MYGQAQYDSLLLVVNDTTKQDSLAVVSCFFLTDENINRNAIDSALMYSSKGIGLATKLNLEYTRGKLMNQRAFINLFYTKNYQQAVNGFIEALVIFEKHNDQERLIDVYLHLGIANYQLKDFETALVQLKKAEDIALKLNSKADIGIIYNNLGANLEKLNRHDEAISIYLKAAVFFKGLNDELNYSTNRLNFLITTAKVYPDSLSNNVNLITEFIELAQVFKKYSENSLLMHCCYHLGVEYKKSKKYNQSIAYLQKADSLATALNDLPTLVLIYYEKFETYQAKGDVTSSIEALKQHKQANDSLYKIDLSKSLADIQTKYETEKKEVENSLLKKDAQINDLALLSEKKYRNISIFCLIISLLFGAIFYNRMRISRSKNLTIEKQKIDLSNQKLELLEANKEVMDSINYAQRIQEALLKAKEHVSKHLPAHFVLYRPKNVVSGDFYWYAEKKGFVYIAVADCTGHGVPGAMLSMLGISYLNEINSSQELYTPAQILDLLKIKVVNELSQVDSPVTVSDGMDISLLRMNLKTGNAVWSGANNPLYIYSNSEFNVINATRQSISFTYKVIPFVDHQISFLPDAIYYLFSDGYIDQFGGPRGKKLKQTGFQKKIKEISNESLDDQLVILETYFDEWKAGFDQLDDVTIIAIKSPKLKN